MFDSTATILRVEHSTHLVTVNYYHHPPGLLLFYNANSFDQPVTMANRPTTPPLLQGPTAKEKKYDRQLRLWAASGQQALEDAHVLLLNSSPGVVGIETLKNLILPGVGNFTIVDEEKVREEDLGINFFLAEESLGKSRADESCRFLQELNPEVQGHAIQEVRNPQIARFIIIFPRHS